MMDVPNLLCWAYLNSGQKKYETLNLYFDSIFYSLINRLKSCTPTDIEAYIYSILMYYLISNTRKRFKICNDTDKYQKICKEVAAKCVEIYEQILNNGYLNNKEMMHHMLKHHADIKSIYIKSVYNKNRSSFSLSYDELKIVYWLWTQNQDINLDYYIIAYEEYKKAHENIALIVAIRMSLLSLYPYIDLEYKAHIKEIKTLLKKCDLSFDDISNHGQLSQIIENHEWLWIMPNISTLITWIIEGKLKINSIKTTAYKPLDTLPPNNNSNKRRSFYQELKRPIIRPTKSIADETVDAPWILKTEIYTQTTLVDKKRIDDNPDKFQQPTDVRMLEQYANQIIKKKFLIRIFMPEKIIDKIIIPNHYDEAMNNNLAYQSMLLQNVCFSVFLIIHLGINAIIFRLGIYHNFGISYNIFALIYYSIKLYITYLSFYYRVYAATIYLQRYYCNIESICDMQYIAYHIIGYSIIIFYIDSTYSIFILSGIFYILYTL